MKLYSHRYVESGGEYYHRVWRTDGASTTVEDLQTGALTERPTWLVDIINVAKLSGALMHPPEPPPNVILWFLTDGDNKLIEFTTTHT
jgi:hypothetical protein